jgi:hypothetical protein
VTIGRYHGRLLQTSNSLNYRLWNLYTNHDKGWLSVDGNYSSAGYYFLSTVYRFISVFALVRQLETEAILLDARIAEKKDYTFLNYVAALHWVMTDAALFEGLSYDNSSQADHFFSDHFRRYSDLCLEDQKLLTFDEFKKKLSRSNELEPVLAFFNGLKPDEKRLRWDRLVALHLVLMAFINSFGYKRQYSKQEKFNTAAGKICNRRLLQNLIGWLPRHDLDNDKEGRKIVKSLGMYPLTASKR